ncbi:hypothetical protein [Haloechinothrix halophila]|uniref:hypothetical protein n=1 Tax=Haloechinothrix halophila TaxID=1069073 RepID=UPI0003FD51FE|nr:hypothetical protein [Haloechinothrix halophila]
MFSAILTWAGAMLGIAILLAMAFGPVVADFDLAKFKRHFRRRTHRESHSEVG